MADVARRARLTVSEQQEIAQMYTSGEDVEEILKSYDIGEGTLYRALQKQNVPTRRGRNSARGDASVEEEVPPTPTPPMEEMWVDTEPKVQKAQSLELVVDKNQTVQAVNYLKPKNKTYVWEIRYTGVILIEAETLVQAATEASKVPAVRRIYTVKLKDE